ncbi:MAG: hypothetical protein ACKVS9_02180 [Phycisphaerae bacterium]
MKPRLLAIHRTPIGIFCVVADRVAPFVRPEPERDEQYTLPTDYTPYRVRRIPLAELPASLYPQKAAVLAAWNALGCVRDFSPIVLAKVLMVEFETTADPLAAPRDLPLFERQAPPPPPHATAAHPRAYRGTKHKPPKPGKLAPLDLRPYLCRPASEQRVLHALRPHLANALPFIDQRHPLAAILRKHGETCLQPFALHSQHGHRAQIAALPSDFRHYFLWLLRGTTMRDCAATLATYRTLDLAHDHALRAAIQVAQVELAANLDWRDALAALPRERRAHAVELVAEHGPHPLALQRRHMPELMQAAELSCDRVFRHRIAFCLDTIAQRKSLRYALDGFRLANDDYEWTSFTLTSNATGVLDTVQRIINLTQLGDHSLLGSNLWHYCGQLRGFQQMLDSAAWSRLDATSIAALISILCSIHQVDLPALQTESKWNWALRRVAEMIEFVEAIEQPHRPRALAALRDFIGDRNDTASLRTHWPATKSLIRAYCRPPYATHERAGCVLVPLALLSRENVARICDAPQRSWRALDRATRRDNESEQVYSAISTLTNELPQLVVEGFVAAPRTLFDAARTIAVMHRQTRVRLIAAFLRTALARMSPASDASSLVRTIDAQLPPGRTNAISKRLRDHVAGQVRLSATQLERDLNRVRAAWPEIQLAALDHLAMQQISGDWPQIPADAKSRHAVLMLHDIDEHRRGMRRLLRAYFEGKPDYAETHPASLRWFAAHPRLDAPNWLAGHCERFETQSSGTLELRLERDPLEALRLGSYFGTCLGLGGMMNQSAAAVVLDVNKQVIYARDCGGRVVARQLIAVAEDDRLICFAVYPKSAPADVRAAFKLYDEQLAAHLGISLHRPHSDKSPYTVAEILSQYCWDDDAWDFSNEPAVSPRSSKSAQT